MYTNQARVFFFYTLPETLRLQSLHEMKKPFDCFLKILFFSQVLGGICTYICTQHFMGKRQTELRNSVGREGKADGLDTSDTKPFPTHLLLPPPRPPL